MVLMINSYFMFFTMKKNNEKSLVKNENNKY